LIEAVPGGQKRRQRIRFPELITQKQT